MKVGRGSATVVLGQNWGLTQNHLCVRWMVVNGTIAVFIALCVCAKVHRFCALSIHAQSTTHHCAFMTFWFAKTVRLSHRSQKALTTRSKHSCKKSVALMSWIMKNWKLWGGGIRLAIIYPPYQLQFWCKYPKTLNWASRRKNSSQKIQEEVAGKLWMAAGWPGEWGVLLPFLQRMCGGAQNPLNQHSNSKVVTLKGMHFRSHTCAMFYRHCQVPVHCLPVLKKIIKARTENVMKLLRIAYCNTHQNLGFRQFEHTCKIQELNGITLGAKYKNANGHNILHWKYEAAF